MRASAQPFSCPIWNNKHPVERVTPWYRTDVSWAQVRDDFAYISIRYVSLAAPFKGPGIVSSLWESVCKTIVTPASVSASATKEVRGGRRDHTPEIDARSRSHHPPEGMRAVSRNPFPSFLPSFFRALPTPSTRDNRAYVNSNTFLSPSLRIRRGSDRGPIGAKT